MRIPIHIAEKLLRLTQGETLAAGSARHPVIEELVAEKIIDRTGRIQKRLSVSENASLFLYLHNKFGINDLQKYIDANRKNVMLRSELVKVSSNSKTRKVRTFKGFLINSYLPVNAMLNDNPITLNFTEGVFQFIYDFERFIPDESLTIVGIENPENFRHIEKQKHLFKNIRPLFVSRYPQNQSKDLRKWLQSIPNSYLHFGDFDFSGIGIYLHEFKKHLSAKAKFFIPDNIETRLAKNGSTERYNVQKINFDVKKIEEDHLIKLISVIHKYKKGLDQEGFVNPE